MTEYIRFETVYWSMPFLFANMAMLNILYKIMGKNHRIRYVYGSPRCLWTGGRLSQIQTSDLFGIEKIVERCISLNSVPVFTFSNTSLKSEDLNDEFCNNLLKIIAPYDCQVITASDLLHNYIKEKYPNIKQVCSVINFGYKENKQKNELELINTYIKEYDRVVIRPEFATDNMPLLKKIENIEKIELLVNQNCAKNCSNSLQHYRIIEKQIWVDETEQEKLFETISQICPRQNDPSVLSNTLSVEQIEYCIDAGIKNLKLQGRTYGFDYIIEELCKYYFSPMINKEEIISEINKYIDDKSKNDEKLQIKELFKR